MHLLERMAHQAATNSEVACVYAALILQDDDVAITGDKITTILKAAHVEVEPFWPGLFAKALEGVDVKVSLIDFFFLSNRSSSRNLFYFW